mmetsp:Transcript_33908/g.37892  ORF Transcript_33908/g.37892 Transcript_33908/m.37892 type:complete len:96 (+) Transcript_33908:144-431(+)
MKLSLSSLYSATLVLVLWILAVNMAVTEGESIRGSQQNDSTNEARTLWLLDGTVDTDAEDEADADADTDADTNEHRQLKKRACGFWWCDWSFYFM